MNINKIEDKELKRDIIRYGPMIAFMGEPMRTMMKSFHDVFVFGSNDTPVYLGENIKQVSDTQLNDMIVFDELYSEVCKAKLYAGILNEININGKLAFLRRRLNLIYERREKNF